MKLENLTLVTGNPAKSREIQRILDIPITVKDLDLDEIQELDIEKIALHKINQAYDLLKTPVLIDDVSFSVVAWNSFPGPLIKWILKAGEGPSLLLKMLENEKNRNAIATLAVGFHDGFKAQIFLGSCKGSISHEIRGENGFGWDRVFIPVGYDLTFAEMDPEIKDKISHRGLALTKFKDFIKANYEI